MDDNKILARFDIVHKRIEDNKTLITTIVSSATAIFAVLAIVFTWNINIEKNDLKTLKKELKEEVKTFLGTNKKEADIVLFTQDGEFLDGKTIDVKIEKRQVADPGEYPGIIAIPIIIRNDGKGSSGVVTIKGYTKKEIELTSSAAFEEDYDYEVYWQGVEQTGVPNLPPLEYAHPYNFSLYLRSPNSIQLGKHDVKVKIYYGSGKMTSAEFYINVTENPTI